MTAYGEDFLFYNVFILWIALSSPIWAANKSNQSAWDVQCRLTFPGTQTEGNMLEESQRRFRMSSYFAPPPPSYSRRSAQRKHIEHDD
jgi:hypothetical protein